MSTFVALDFETANGNRGSACSIGLVKCSNSEVIERCHFLIRPKENVFGRFNTMIHGIKPEDVENERTFDELWDKISRFMGDAPLVAHNASFDMNVLKGSLEIYGLHHEEWSFLCSIQIAQQTWPGLDSYKLNRVANHIGVKLKHHNALSDAEACARIVLSSLRIHNQDDILSLSKHLDIKPGTICKCAVSTPCIMSFRACASSNEKCEDHFLYDDHPFQGKIIVITLDLASMERSDAQQKIESRGGRLREAVSGKTSILVIGGGMESLPTPDRATGKIKKALALKESGSPIEIIFEDDFLDLLNWKP